MTNLTTAQIRALRDEAIAARDVEMELVCDVALGGHPRDCADSVSTTMWYRLRDMTQDEARERCADVIAEAEAQRS